MSAAGEVLRQQNEQVVTFSLVELLTQLLFVAMALALVLQNETVRRLSPNGERMAQLQAKLKARTEAVARLNRQLRTLRAELDDERNLVVRLLGIEGTTLASPDVVHLSRQDFERYANLKGMLDESIADNARLRGQLAVATGRGAGRPACSVTVGSLLNIRTLGSNFQVSPSWAPGAAEIVRGIPGTSAILGPQSEAGFKQHAAQIQTWALAQNPPCTFRVTVTAADQNLTRYLRQLAVVEQFFYAHRTH